MVIDGVWLYDPKAHALLPYLKDDIRAATGMQDFVATARTRLGNHSFRATGITAYLKNGGTLERAAAMANHASTRTTQFQHFSGEERDRLRGAGRRSGLAHAVRTVTDDRRLLRLAASLSETLNALPNSLQTFGIFLLVSNACRKAQRQGQYPDG